MALLGSQMLGATVAREERKRKKNGDGELHAHILMFFRTHRDNEWQTKGRETVMRQVEGRVELISHSPVHRRHIQQGLRAFQ